MQGFQTSLFYDLQELIRNSSLLKKYYYLVFLCEHSNNKTSRRSNLFILSFCEGQQSGL